MRDILESSAYTNRIGYIVNEAAPEEPTKTEVVKEIQCGSKKRVVGKGKLQTADEKNRNGRWYSLSELKPQVEAPRQQELISNGRMLGENGHPLSKDLYRQQQIIESLCSVRYLKIWMEGNDVWAWYVGHNNALGDTFDDNLRCGINPSFSLRALGSVNNTSRGAEVVGLKVITWDDVIYPSHPNAYGQGLVNDADIAAADADVRARMNMESAYLEAASLVDESLMGQDITRDKINESGMVVPITNKNVIDFLKNESNNFHIFTESFDTLYDDIKLLKESHLVQLTDKSGNILFANLESYVHNGLMNYFYKNM